MTETESREAAISKAVDEVTDVVADTVGRLADEVLGRPEFGTSEWREQREATRGKAERQARLREWHLVKIRIERGAKVSMTGDVLGARENGASWADIAEACGTSRQAAHERFAKFTNDQEPEQATEADEVTDVVAAAVARLAGQLREQGGSPETY